MFEWRGEISAQLPRIVAVQQKFIEDAVKDIDSCLAKEFKKPEIDSKLKRGMTIALAVGSRGIGEIDSILYAVIRELNQRGIKSFIVPAMGSHGGACAEGQAKILREYNITEESLGVPVHSSMAVCYLGQVGDRVPVYFDKYSKENADAVVPICRVKKHTSFRGPIESGLHKMLAIGLGKHRGAQTLHAFGVASFPEIIPKVGQFILEQVNIPFGFVVVENALGSPYLIEAVEAKAFAEREPELLQISTKVMAQLYFKILDVLAICEMGKNISGSGIDPNLTCRFDAKHMSDGPLEVKRIAVLDLTHESHGNATGIGAADVTTRKLIEKIDFHSTYENCITGTRISRAKIPMVMSSDRDALCISLQTCSPLPSTPRLVLIKNTLNLKNIYVSEGLLSYVESHEKLEVVGKIMDFPFNDNGDLSLQFR